MMWIFSGVVGMVAGFGLAVLLFQRKQENRGASKLEPVSVSVADVDVEARLRQRVLPHTGGFCCVLS